ncbi:unnamed protein product [Cochlearia groenlandica]
MTNRYIPLRLTIFLSFSIAASSSSSFTLSSSSHPKATAQDLLSVLSPPSSSSKLNPAVSRELRSCLRFLVPFELDNSRSELLRCSLRREAEDSLVWWPPEAVLELARLAVDSGGDPAAIERALDPKSILVPDVEGTCKDKCQLTRTPYGYHFIAEEVNSYFEFLFRLIESRGPSVGFNVSLTRYDLFHGHLFIASDSGRLGILFHAKEYPGYDKKVFPYNMGYCQRGSDVKYEDDSMNLRNILWLAPLPSKSTKDWLAPGVLVVLDANPDGIIYRDLIPDYVKFVRTIYEDDLGASVVDVNYLNVGDHNKPDYRLFIC